MGIIACCAAYFPICEPNEPTNRSGWFPAAIKASKAPPSGSSITSTFMPELACWNFSASLRMVSIMAPFTTEI